MDWLTRPFHFASTPVSVLTFVIYAVVFAAVLRTDQTPDVPKNQHGLSLQKAYEDLHTITARPHPYNSHANDDVHAFLLDRLKPIVDSQDYIHLSEDRVSNATWVMERGGFYFESTNILVKVDGTDTPQVRSDGVVFSAHYDSVSTAPGATDNGMSIVTLLQMVEYLAAPERRPHRTAVFLFNNGEEDGLNGVHMFFEHPWANLTTTFVNLEGAAAGGRPILFRTSSLAAARSFAAKGVRHPHGNVLSADAFERGVIRSLTDFSVFAKGIDGEKDGMAGIDFAFYKNRAYYHTPFDSIPGMGRDEGRKALWAMMETIRGAGLELLNGPGIDDNGDTGVYFDILGRTMVAFTLRTLFAAHVIFLIIGPSVVLGLLAWVLVLTKHAWDHNHELDEQPTAWQRLRLVTAQLMGWGRFWLSFLVAILVNIALVVGYVKVNPNVIYSKKYVVLTTFLTASFLSYTVSLQLFNKIWPSPPSSQKFAILLEIYFLSWIFLVIGTVGVNNLRIGGAYLFTAWNICAWLAAVVALIEAVLRARWASEHGTKPDLDVVDEPEPAARDQPAGHRFVRGIRYDAPQRAENGEEGADGEPEETDPTEITPLMQQQRRRSTGGREYIVGVDNEPLQVYEGGKRAAVHEYGWWILQMLALVPLPALLLFQVTLILVHALSNTLADGSPAVVVYGGLALLCTLIFINVTPFAHQIHRTLWLSVLAIFVITLIYAWTAFPFAQDAPLKLFFQQSVEIDLAGGSMGGLVVNDAVTIPQDPVHALHQPIISARTLLTGIPGYVDKKIVRELPSSWGRNITYETDLVLRPGLLTCGWESNLLPSPGGEPLASDALEHPEWLTFSTERINASAARITIGGRNTRNCALTFEHPITSFAVRNGGGRLQPGYEMPAGGTTKLQMWSRTWGKAFDVEVAWASGDADFNMDGRAACEWAEYASGTAGSAHASQGGQIPALEEVLRFLPLWATPTKWTMGLVEVWTKFSV
ncbi:Zn-dependent exopeptidase [Phanerochaete sordida]|uniref:Peptide hydrolase n=1 Tax=Phanerochaete sordida TaxID=48140 RepID=A0A9P3GGY1_9APHY|nr:Zn-dependent exopeptidase [Phanerochaete sordida]